MGKLGNLLGLHLQLKSNCEYAYNIEEESLLNVLKCMAIRSFNLRQ
jgi:hypothetical protein